LRLPRPPPRSRRWCCRWWCVFLLGGLLLAWGVVLSVSLFLFTKKPILPFVLRIFGAKKKKRFFVHFY
jgi:hypothetical protein